MPQTRRGSLTRREIGLAALAVVDEEGAEALTVRRIAARLGVRAPSLYSHVDGKDDILELITEIITADMPALDLHPADWRAGLLNWARTYHAAFAEHPNAVGIIARRAVTITESRQAYEDVIAMLVEAGMGPAAALRVVLGIDYVVLGSILAPFSPAFDQPLGEDFPLLRTAIRATEPAEVNRTAFREAVQSYIRGIPDPA
ncbi:DNA-binding transcriptional regulator, AcrR family [Saccharopolyspora antimicrobica]|uniref:DNA-binding transcriptional regulator, AcrR family n=1 Tax=Saccharopolyspora antimicrobica TaxID=455193 RepID=A0A1I5JEN0_9PSEU|nr:TetR family transcriptional regulator [Saccharopolyspora antimicrobica]RKT82502.1 TetR family transcriptional regulator [Saccharopolyspora antimicrobica]SFO71222.1 DNA-binding transcriptional regulator, AcrR family [Saccharopolyspora antimicrobica]